MYLGMLFSSGLGATTTICHSLKSGDHVVSMDDVYGGICVKDVARTSILTLHGVNKPHCVSLNRNQQILQKGGCKFGYTNDVCGHDRSVAIETSHQT
jgi:cystathionine beta-lyase/cystathionine gamma-synthase